jgi:uncharacterized Tic20 family protein
LKKQICMEGGYMLGSFSELLSFIIIMLIIIAPIVVGYQRNKDRYCVIKNRRKNGR